MNQWPRVQLALIWPAAIVSIGCLIAQQGGQAEFAGIQPAAASMVAPSSPATNIRVAVVQRKPTVDLAILGGFQITGADGATSLRSGDKLSRVAVRATRAGIVVGDEQLAQRRVRVEPRRDATISLNGQRLRGTLEIVQQADNTLTVVNHVGLEDYLRGVLAKEAPHYWPMESLKAIAIAARTYVLYQRLEKASVDYDVSGDVMSQVYGGRSGEKGRTTRAVRETAGLILTYHGKIFPSFYHSTCGGMTENGSAMGPYDIEPLQGRLVCTFCSASPFYRWTRILSRADVAWALKQAGRGSIWPVTGMEVIARTPAGRVTKVRIDGTRQITVSGAEFRQLFGFDQLRSTAFTITPRADGFVLDGRGWGHGVGLCQWGAAELAQRSLSASEILAYYYPTAQLVDLDELHGQFTTIEGGH